MSTEFMLSYTGSEINEKLGKIDTIEEQVNNLSGGNADLVSGIPGQVVGFDSDGNMVPMHLLEGVKQTVTVVDNNMFDASAGYTEGYNSPAGPINLETLEVPLDSPIENGDPTAYWLSKQLIFMEPNTTYAFSNFSGRITLFVASTGNRSEYESSTDMTAGDGCLLYTTPSSKAGYYAAINFNVNISPTAFENMVIVKGDKITTETVTVVSGEYLHNSIKVKAEQVEWPEEDSGTSGDASSGESTCMDAAVALAETAKKVKKYQKPDSLTIALMSDTHFSTTDKNADEKLATARLMAKASGVYHVDIVGNLGDLIPGKDTLDVTKSNLMAIVGATASNNAYRIAVARGNHDDNGWYSQGFGGSYKPDEMLNQLAQYQYIDSMDYGLVRDVSKPDGGYGYFDHEASKIRVFLLNTSDIPYVLKDDGSYRYTSYGWAAFSNEQINFVANALKFEDKEAPNDWAALFLMHIPMDTTNADGYRFGIRDALIRGVTQMLGVITAYKNGNSYQYDGSVYNASTGDVADDFMVSIDVDYSEKGVGDVIGFISGHTHADNYSNAVGIERSPSHGYSFLSLMGGTAFANFIINRSNNSVSFVKYGAVTPDLTEGASVVAPDKGSIESGEWTIYYDQFRPITEDIFTGWDSYGKGYKIDPSSPDINLDTMELINHAESAAYICSKVVPVTPNSTYKIPSAWSGLIAAYTANGAKSSYPSAVDADGYKTVTTEERHYYLVFQAHTSTYADYANMTVELVV